MHYVNLKLNNEVHNIGIPSTERKFIEKLEEVREDFLVWGNRKQIKQEMGKQEQFKNGRDSTVTARSNPGEREDAHNGRLLIKMLNALVNGYKFVCDETLQSFMAAGKVVCVL
ncbi:hypothetical protein NQ315_000686 [Exocentrus adspersus]|uniref:Uncharacterized protein n=1 Tax=Exocentrus adspersus TaxID=1586481 RepID=A0AAV8WDF2_9CUCU|nr:hypothetical protein NQ315_000686 [Exocentrus adspersus]